MDSLTHHDRDEKGRFLAGNAHAVAGGHARARSLPAHRRADIARRGYHAMVQKHFKGDYARANQWLIQKGLHAQDPFPQNGAFPNPGPHPAHI